MTAARPLDQAIEVAWARRLRLDFEQILRERAGHRLDRALQSGGAA